MTKDELSIVKEALLDVQYAVAGNIVPISRMVAKRNQAAMKIITLEQVKLHNGELKNVNRKVAK